MGNLHLRLPVIAPARLKTGLDFPQKRDEKSARLSDAPKIRGSTIS